VQNVSETMSIGTNGDSALGWQCGEVQNSQPGVGKALTAELLRIRQLEQESRQLENMLTC